MTITYVKGDLFAANERAIAHGCNCHGFMGAGFAALIRDKFSDAYSAYARACRDRSFYPGVAQPVITMNQAESTTIYNLATQNAPGRNAQYPYIQAAFANMIRHMDFVGNSRIAMPMIGAGIGGLDWWFVHQMLTNMFDKDRSTIVVYYLKDEDLPESLR